jgi:hypothetical protein
LDTFNGRLNAIASSYYVPLAVEAYFSDMTYFIEKRGNFNEFGHCFTVCLIELLWVELDSGFDSKKVNNTLHELYSILFLINIIRQI